MLVGYGVGQLKVTKYVMSLTIIVYQLEAYAGYSCRNRFCSAALLYCALFGGGGSAVVVSVGLQGAAGCGLWGFVFASGVGFWFRVFSFVLGMLSWWRCHHIYFCYIIFIIYALRVTIFMTSPLGVAVGLLSI